MKKVPLTNHTKPALVSDHRYEQAMTQSWRLASNARAIVGFRGVKLHDFLLGKASDGCEWDHIDGDIWNNTDENLRQATRSQNIANQGKRVGRYTSRYKGVSWNKRRNKWEASIAAHKRIFLGYFDDEEEAAKAYDRASIKYHGEFAKTNFPKKQYDN